MANTFKHSVFISYRHSDSADITDIIETSLRETFPEADIFRDSGGIKPGEDFIKILESRVSKDLIFLAVIGPDWIGMKKTGRKRRIDDTKDILRRELEWRFITNKDSHNIIPILVKGALMPNEDDLPASLRELSSLNALELKEGAGLKKGINKLITLIEAIFKKATDRFNEIDEMVNESLAEEKATGPNTKNSGLRFVVRKGVPGFSLLGRWICDIKSKVPDHLTGPFCHTRFEFKVENGDYGDIMNGVFRIAEKGWFKTKVFKDTWHYKGEIFLLMEKSAREKHEDRYDIIHFQGVVNGMENYIFKIPVYEKIGDVYHGTDSHNRYYELRQLETSEERIGL